MTEPVTALVPLSDLYIHPFNTRTTPPDDEIEALADSIDQMGLLQNLSGYDDGAWQEGGIGIVAGGRRLRALQKLVARSGGERSGVTVPVLITTDKDTARLWASAENAARQPLHPADEVCAYARMSDAGSQPAMIAKAFAVTERHVRQRLTLAALPVPALGALRANRITLDQAAALTTAQSEEALLAELRRVLTSTWGINAADIRRNLMPRGIRPADRRVKWLGLDAYRNAGGAMQEDLFTDDTLLLDEALLDKLFIERLEECAEFNRGKGYAWVKVATDAWIPHDLTENLTRVDRTPVDLPEADAEEIERLSESDDLTDEEYARLEELEERAAGDISDEDRAASGIFVYVDSAAKLAISGPWREKAKAPESETADVPKVEKLSQSLVEDGHRIQRLAIQTALLSKPELVLDLLTVSLTAPLWNWQRPLTIGPTPGAIEPDKADGTTIDERLVDAINEGRALGGGRDLSPAHLTEVQGLGKKDRNAMLTAALARLFTPVQGDFAAHIARLAGADIRKVWTPTAENYFARLPVARLDAIWTELVPGSDLDDNGWFATKKALKAKDLERLFRDQDFREALFLDRDLCKRIDTWLPEEMRWPDIVPVRQEEAA